MKNFYQRIFVAAVISALILCSDTIFAARIGIYPGSFDPVHIGHLEVARSALVKLKLDAVFFMPNGSNPRKPQMSPIKQRAEILKAAFTDYKQPGFKLFPIDEIEKSAADGDPADAPVRLLEIARQTFAHDTIFQILGTDSVFKVIEGSGLQRIGPNWQLAVCNRPGAPFLGNKSTRYLEKKGLFHLFDSFSDAAISSTAIRKACASGDLEFVAAVMTPSSLRQLIRQGSHGLCMTGCWLHEILHDPGDKIPENRHPMSEPVLLKQNYEIHSSLPDYVTRETAPADEAIAIDFSVPHSMGDLSDYLKEKLTETGLKVIANPEVKVAIFPGNQQQLSHWLARQQITEGMRITRNRSYITLGIHLVKTGNGSFLAIIDEVYGKDRMLHTQSMVAAALALSGRNQADFVVIEENSGLFPTDFETIYAEELQRVVPGTIDAAIIGFHWKIVNELEQRLALYKRSSLASAISTGKWAQDWRKRLNFLEHPCEPAPWPRRHFANQNLPYSYLAFKDSSGKPLNILLTRNVYGDQLKALLNILIKEKHIKKFVLFGNAGGLKADAKIGDCFLPTAVRKFDSCWQQIDNSFSSFADDKFKPGRVYSVFSPIVETNAFIDQLKNQQAVAVDVEAAYLSDFKDLPGISFGSILVVSDIPGTHKTLAQLEENEKLMEDSLTASLDLILKSLDLALPGDHRFPIASPD